MRNETVIREGKENVLIAAGELAVTLLPKFGGKISSIQFRNRELLQVPLQPIRSRTRTMSFDDADASGWDECLPSVAACTVQTPSGEKEIPDHGDLWRIEWEEAGNRGTREPADAEGTVALRADCFSLPLRLDRRLILRAAGGKSQMDLHYTVTNLSDDSVPWSWSAHPLFAVEAGDEIQLPDTIRTLRVEGSAAERLGKSGASASWPKPSLNGTRADLNLVQPAESGIGDKLFAGPLRPQENWCALLRPSAGVRIKMSFDSDATPYLGLWLCYGGWPEKPGPKQMCVAFEPATAPVDSLAETGPWSRTLKAGSSFSWPVCVQFEKV